MSKGREEVRNGNSALCIYVDSPHHTSAGEVADSNGNVIY